MIFKEGLYNFEKVINMLKHDCRWALQNRPLMGTSKPATFQVKYIVLHLLFRFIVQPITFPFNCKHVS
ncbi:MAG TPA: hypothetical protein VKY57_07710, partial [Chitinispirillaceae bacterium]|nr:hypothetical protein [Chitinispirillaceae bacterium]